MILEIPAERIMEEEVTQKVVSISVRATGMTAIELTRALKLFLAEQPKTKNKYAKGRQTLKKLVGQNAETTNIEISDGNIGAFKGVARKYGIDYALKKDKSCHPPKYYVFFQAKDMEVMTMAFKEFVAKNEKKKERTPVRDVLKKFMEAARSRNMERELTKSKDRGQSL